MTTLLTTLPLWAVFAVYLRRLAQWWPVLDNPEHFNQLKMEEDDNARHFRSLVVGLRPIVARHGE